MIEPTFISEREAIYRQHQEYVDAYKRMCEIEDTMDKRLEQPITGFLDRIERWKVMYVGFREMYRVEEEIDRIKDKIDGTNIAETPLWRRLIAKILEVAEIHLWRKHIAEILEEKFELKSRIRLFREALREKMRDVIEILLNTVEFVADIIFFLLEMWGLIIILVVPFSPIFLSYYFDNYYFLFGYLLVLPTLRLVGFLVMETDPIIHSLKCGFYELLSKCRGW